MKIFTRNSYLIAATILTMSTGVMAETKQQGARTPDCSPGMGYELGVGDGMGNGQGMNSGYGPRMHMSMAYQAGVHLSNRFRAFDENNNGLIDADEAASESESVFLLMDFDDDGKLTEEEFMAMNMGPMATLAHYSQRHEQQQARKLARFKPMDTDDSGKVSQVEFLEAAKARFDASDLDKDGSVTVWEFRSVRR